MRQKRIRDDSSIVVTFTTYGQKITILKNKKYLKTEGVYLKEDFSPEIVNRRKTLMVQLQLSKDKEAGKKAYLRYDKLIVQEPSIKKKSETDEEQQKGIIIIL